MQKQSEHIAATYEVALTRLLGRKIYREYVTRCDRALVEPERYFDIYMKLHFVGLPAVIELRIWQAFRTLLFDAMVLKKAERQYRGRNDNVS